MGFEDIETNDEAKILVVDDDKLNIQILVSLLENAHYEVTAVTNGNLALMALNSKNFDMVLLNIMKPHIDGFEICKLIKQNTYLVDIPIIFITAVNDPESVANAFKIGGVDYITIPFNSNELLARIKIHLTLQKRTNKLKDALRIESILATTDSLTRTYNRLKFNTILEEQIKVAKRYNEPLSVIFFDLDHFKKINDIYGHEVGDIVLVKLSKLIKRSIRNCDAFARWVGEKFIISLPKTDIFDCINTAEKLRLVISNHKFQGLKNISCSFGVAALKDSDTQDSLLLRADKALYNAKENGRNKVESL